MKLNKKALIFICLAIFVAGVGVGGYLLNSNPSIAEDNSSESTIVKAQGPVDIASIVKKVGPAVVKIETITEQPSSTDPFFNDPFFREFFGGNQFNVPRQSKGLGSGFIISKDGYILTNQHVIENAIKVTVVLEGKEKPIEAKVIGQDAQLDLAVLKIPADKNLPVINLGSSKNVHVGDWVVAIGNPYGLDHTVTAGVISAMGRPLTIDGNNFKNLLQTDASINPGNSGGPLLNLKGEAIGINTAINAQAQGIGFAIPTETVEEVLDQLIKNGKVIRPYLGVVIQDLNSELKEYFKYNKNEGAIIAHIEPGSPAEKAGLQRGDIIVEFNKKKVNNSEELANLIKDSKVGDKVVLLVFRNGKTEYITLKIGEQ